ncbi:SAM-dependent methyltransferase [Gloeomargarita lithophora Alchichica-D10]|uniref:SAM-dependent methyltransferase n=2 Tax=Gloeomargarita TaxID=1188227 RepID=A0A1J0ABJ4_9CYAN|nr:SAM-dependent methyltransferase [Gloeomargarita lithophora Alchichica-D10]
MNWQDGYVTEIPYTQGFYHHLSPANLDLCLLTKQVKSPRLDQRFTYCELACGQGLTTNVLAAAYPQGEFYATDFNPTHVAQAQDLAQATGLTNVTFSDQSFQEYLETDLPPFDFISLHGIYSWISGENRRVIQAFLKQKLKVGGVVYVSYNTLPGWAVMAPIQKLMQFQRERSTGTVVERLKTTLEFVELLKTNQGIYLQHPWLQSRLEQLKSQDVSYLVHELFNQHWHPLYVDEVMTEMATAKLNYVGSAHLVDHVDAFNLTPTAINHLTTLSDPVLRELVRDFYLNTQFRRDVYVRGAVTLSGEAQVSRLQNMQFILTVLPNLVKLEHQTGAGQVQLQASLYQPVVEHLASGAVTVGELVVRLAPQGITLQQIGQTLIVLTGLGYAHPVVGNGAQRERFNRVIIERAETAGELQFLASPLIGNGVKVSHLELLLLLAEQRQQPAVEFVWQILSRRGLQLTHEGKVLDTPEANRKFLKEQAANFQHQGRPLLQQLGI